MGKPTLFPGLPEEWTAAIFPTKLQESNVARCRCVDNWLKVRRLVADFVTWPSPVLTEHDVGIGRGKADGSFSKG